MTTIEYRIGETSPLVLALEQEDGTAPDQTGLGVELRITANSQCVNLHGAPEADGYAFDLSGLDLRPRLYPASIWLSADGESEFGGAIFINITGGC